MIFNEFPVSNKYHPFKCGDLDLLIFKMGYIWEICLAKETNDDGYPLKIGSIENSGMGELTDSLKLAYALREEYRGMGIAFEALRMYLGENDPGPGGFEVQIKNYNTASISLATKLGFKKYKENEGHSFYILK